MRLFDGLCQSPLQQHTDRRSPTTPLIARVGKSCDAGGAGKRRSGIRWTDCRRVDWGIHSVELEPHLAERRARFALALAGGTSRRSDTR